MSDEEVIESIKVLVRVRADQNLNQEEIPFIIVNDSQNSLQVKSLDEKRSISCAFDAVLGPNADQFEVYEKIKYATESVIKGFNSTIFAYGQTGSGKTHTMYGPAGFKGARIENKSEDLTDTVGIVPRAVSQIFDAIANEAVLQSSVICSFTQCYNENLYDLL
eukprot:gene6651-13468_t